MAQEMKEFPNDVGMLDELIGRYYKQLCEDANKNAKLGDLLKMIELRQRLTPTDSGKAAFWKMMENIRKKSLSEHDKKDGASVRQKPQRNNKKKRRQA